MTLHWNLEEIALNNGAFFLRGWLFDENRSINRLTLIVRNRLGGEKDSLEIICEQPRVDVAAQYRHIQNGANAGFVGLGCFRCPPTREDSLHLGIMFVNGEIEYLRLNVDDALNPSAQSRWRVKMRLWIAMAAQALILARNGNWQEIQHRVSTRLSHFGANSLAQKEPWKRMLNGMINNQPVHLIVDHDLGGGANHYREQQIEAWLAEGSAAVVLTFQISNLAYGLSIHSQGNSVNYSTTKEDLLLEALDGFCLDSIVFNNAVSFRTPLQIPPLLISLKQRNKARLTVILHDHFTICPSIYLLDNEGEFCAVPDLKRCDQCLPANNYLFSSFYHGTISTWRSGWGQLLAYADTIIAFSESSASLIRDAYPEWQKWARIEIRPQRLKRTQEAPLRPAKTSSMIIGVVGQIGFHKGSHVVRDLAEEIRAQGAGERIVVIGSLECRVDASVVHQTGRYKRQELRQRLADSGVNVILFPSICPETFSHVCSELIQLELPIACFNQGAQAEKVSSYSRGRILTSKEPESILTGLREFYTESYT